MTRKNAPTGLASVAVVDVGNAFVIPGRRRCDDCGWPPCRARSLPYVADAAAGKDFGQHYGGPIVVVVNANPCGSFSVAALRFAKHCVDTC